MIKKEFFKSSEFLSTIIILIISFFFFLYKIRKDNDLYSNGIYTVGKITDIEIMKGGRIYNYEFKFNGFFHNGDMRSGELRKIGDKCYVIFNPMDLEQNKMLLSLPLVSDSIYEANESWKELPIYVSKESIKNALKR